MKVTCDVCHKQFNTDIKQRTEQIEDKVIVITYFVCSFCNKEYLVCVDDEQTIEIKEMLRKEIQLLKVNELSETEYNNLWNKISLIKDKLKRESDKLEKEYKGE